MEELSFLHTSSFCHVKADADTEENPLRFAKCIDLLIIFITYADGKEDDVFVRICLFTSFVK